MPVTWQAMTRVHLDPALAEVLEHARRRAEEAGELRGPTAVEVPSPLSPKARQILAAWISDGGYSQAVATVIATDPELADQ